MEAFRPFGEKVGDAWAVPVAGAGVRSSAPPTNRALARPGFVQAFRAGAQVLPAAPSERATITVYALGEVVIGGDEPIPTQAAWFGHRARRLLIVGSTNALGAAPAGTDVLRAPTPLPEPDWVLEQLAVRAVQRLLLEGGPHINAAFLAARRVDELCWTIGPRLLGTDALPMIVGLPGHSASPLEGRLVSVLRHDDELFVRYRFS